LFCGGGLQQATICIPQPEEGFRGAPGRVGASGDYAGFELASVKEISAHFHPPAIPKPYSLVGWVDRHRLATIHFEAVIDLRRYTPFQIKNWCYTLEYPVADQDRVGATYGVYLCFVAIPLSVTYT